jgi:hypothetical protein
MNNNSGTLKNNQKSYIEILISIINCLHKYSKCQRENISNFYKRIKK